MKLCLDVNLFYDRQSEGYVRESVERCREHIVYTHYGAWNFSETSDGDVVQDPAPSFGGLINYEAFVDALRRNWLCRLSGFGTAHRCSSITGLQASKQ